MKCKKIRDLIATDYIDGEIDGQLKATIEEHLRTCESCRKFEQDLREMVIAPLKASKRRVPPEAVWENIKERIKNKKPIIAVPDWLERLRPVFVIPKPVYAAVTAVLIIAFVLFATHPFNGRSEMGSYLEEQMQYIYYVGVNGTYENHMDVGTAIEEYLM